MSYQTSQLTVYKASAGSGKTFTLAVEYIKLLISDPHAYRYILAVTFTNKATAEMKERILGQLYGIMAGDPASHAYLHVICEGLKLPEEEVRKKAGEALFLLIHDYSRFRVETIDSFFQSVMRNLARELELNANINISLSNEEVLDNAVDTLIENLNRRSPLLSWLLEFVQERIQDDKQWNVSRELKKFGRNVFDETYIEKGDALRERLKDPACIPQYRKRLEQTRDEVKDVMNGFAEQFFFLMEEYRLEVPDLYQGKSGVVGYFTKLRKGIYDETLVNSYVAKCMESPENWTKKSSPRRGEITELAKKELLPLLEETEKARKKCYPILNSCSLSLKHINPLRLLNQIDQEVRELNHKENRFLLSDTNNLLRRLIQDGDSSFIYEKIGTTLKHIMIDEFQDTSRMQWNNFKMLLAEGLAQGYNSLIVGDVKQSIYRWRNGDWTILNNLKGKLDGVYPIEEKTLNTNRRSESNIIYFNNAVFTQGIEYLNGLYKMNNERDCDDLLQAYADVCQESPKTEANGYVQVSFVEGQNKEEYATNTLAQLAKYTQALVQRGVRLSDITILVRVNSNIPLIADYFSQNLPYRIVSDEAFRLDASSAVKTLIDALRYLDDENDRIALARLASTYQREVLGKDTGWNTILLNNLEDFLPPAFLQEHNCFRLMPLYELLEALFSLFELSKLQQQDAYLFAFFDAVIEYLQDHSSDLASFLQFWDEKMCAKTIPTAQLDGIRILSIHKSKGLEFHTVLLPFCDWSMETERNDHLLWCTPQSAPFNELELTPIDYSAKMAQSAYQKDYAHEQIQLWVDNLNVLYVAFTRASKNLFVWGRSSKRNTISEMLEIILPRIAKRMDLEFEEGVPFHFGKLCLSKEEEEHKADTNPLTSIPKNLPVKMESFMNRIDFRQSNRSADFIRGDEPEDEQAYYIKQGRVLHYLFSTLRTADDIEPTLQEMETEGLFDSRELIQQARTLVARALARTEAKDWFSGEWELFNECSIVYIEQGELQTRRPDRVMIKDGHVVVVDFKFGKKSPAYNQQVQEYMHLMQQMGYSQIDGYLWYIYKNELEKV